MADGHALLARRLRQAIVTIAGLLLLMALVNAVRGGHALTAGIELATAACLALPYWRHRDGHARSAVTWLAALLLLALLPLAVGGRGLLGIAPMGYVGLILLVGLHGSRRQLAFTLAAVLASLGAVYVLQPIWLARQGPEAASGPHMLILTCLMVAAIGALVWVSARDRREALARLQRQTQSLLATKTTMEALAFRDALTQLPNRTWAEQSLSQALEVVNGQRHAAVILFDLDNFRLVNESLGYAAGDTLLRQIALRLQSDAVALRGLARFSSDEFIVVLDPVNGADEVDAIAKRVARWLEQPFVIDGMDITLTASLGLALAPRDGADVDVLIKSAELALRRAKARGRDCVQWFDAGMRHQVGEHLQMASALRLALAHEQLQLHYQPKIDLASGRVVGAEALLRWPHPERGWIEPTAFIPVTESTGLISALGAWVIDRACRDWRAWQHAGLAHAAVAVNVSPMQLRREGIEQTVQRALASHRLPPGALELELTEAVFVGDVPSLQEALARLADLGVRLAIDDFGTGYSNLGYLQHYPVHALKIDQSFVRRMCASRHDDGIVRAVIAMAHSLDLQVVAEGVEDEPTRARLSQHGCDLGQGFYWAQALPLEDFIAFALVREREFQAPEALRAANSAR